MLFIRGPDDARRVSDPETRRAVEERFEAICAGEAYDPDLHGSLLVVEAGDTLESIEAESGLPITTNPFDGARWPAEDFVPVAEFIAASPTFIDALYLFSDSGAGTNLIIPRSPIIDRNITALFTRFSVPAPELVD